MKHLPSILKMVQLLHTTLNRQLDRQTASNLTLDELINSNPVLANNRESILSGVKSFMEMWSKLSRTLSEKLSSQIVSKFGPRDTDPSSLIFHQLTRDDPKDVSILTPVSYLLPASFGSGIFIYALIVFLVDTQNEFIRFYQILRGKQDSRIDLDAINASNCINVSPRRDLLNMIYLNSNYTLENVKELNFEFNYDKIQESVERKFLFGKQVIDSTVMGVFLFLLIFIRSQFRINTILRIFQLLNTRTQ